jgi:hypothetical protein
MPTSTMSFGVLWLPRIEKRTSTVDCSWERRIPPASAVKAIAAAASPTPRNKPSRR